MFPTSGLSHGSYRPAGTRFALCAQSSRSRRELRMAGMGHYRSLVSSIGTAALTGTYREHTWQAPLPKATAIGGLPVPLAAIALPRPVRPCFSRPGVEEFQSVVPDLLSPRARVGPPPRRSRASPSRTRASTMRSRPRCRIAATPSRRSPWCRRRSGCRSNAGSRSRAARSGPSSSWRNTASAA
jgi:hypothetical protein